jgi:hypothetical protein
MPDIISEFRQRYPQYNDIPDAQVFMKLAGPGMFKKAFPEYQDLDDHTIGKNLAAEAGKVDTGQPWYKTAASDIGGMLKEAGKTLLPGGKAGPITVEEADKADAARTQEFNKNAEARKKAGYSLPYRVAANTLEGLGLFNTAPMEQAAAQGHTGEVVGHAIPPVVAAVAPLAVEGVVGAGRAVRNAAMEEPVVARQKAMNVTPKSKQAIRAQKEGTTAAPYLKGAKNLADVQARIPVAKQEIFQPYMDAVAKHDATGQMLTAPDGTPVTAGQLEQLRKETSAQLQSTRKMQPTEQWTAVQKGQQIADLTKKYGQITSELDPAIKNQGIDPKRTRATFGAIKGVEKRFEGRSTLLENKPSGLQKMGNVDLTKPETYVGAPASGARDIAAGRGWWSQKPTDVQVREGFRTAESKPDLTVTPPAGQKALPPGPIVTPPPAAGPISGTPPAVATTSRAQRLGLLLPEQSESSARAQIPTGYTEPAAPSTVHYNEAPPAAPEIATEPSSGQTPNRRIVRDPATGKMKVQYLTSSGGEIVREKPPAPVATEPKISTDSMGIKWAETPDGVKISIPPGIRDENVMKYAQNKLAQQVELRKSIKAQVPESTAKPAKREVYMRYLEEKPKAMGTAPSPPLAPEEHTALEKQVGFDLTDQQAKILKRRNVEHQMMTHAVESSGKPEETFQRAEDIKGITDIKKRRK